MAAGQQWLFGPSRPLVERLGRPFFRQAPARPGIYLMRDATGEVVYVGKAKNLRQRLQSYRVANPEHMPRRHLRMLREVVQINFCLCANESAALAQEARFLRRLKPKFNRAGVWPGKARFLTWRFLENGAQFSVDVTPGAGWERFGPLGGSAIHLHSALVRLLWLALNPKARFTQLPNGWAQERFALPVTIACGARAPEIRLALEHLFWGTPDNFSAWVRTSTNTNLPVFDQAAVVADLEEITTFASNYRSSTAIETSQLALL